MTTNLEDQIKALEEERLALFKQKEPIDTRLVELYDILEALKNKRDKARIKRGEFKFPDYDLMLNFREESSASYKEAQRQFDKLGLRSSGYRTDTLQTIVQVALYPERNKKNKNRNLKAYVGLTKLLPHIKPIEERGVKGKYIDLFEHTLSRNCVWGLFVESDENSTVLLHNGYNTNKKFENLKDAFKYCAEHHWYE